MGEFQVVILAAGYGTRLTSDLERTETESWRRLSGVPKPLLPLGGVPLISRWLELLARERERISTICVVTNNRFYSQFVSWKEGLEDSLMKEKLIIYNDFSTSNEGRVGAVRDLALAVSVEETEQPVLVIAGDTIFSQHFSLASFIHTWSRLQEECSGASLIISAPCAEADVPKHGILEADLSGRVTSFLEKPAVTETQSRSQSPCFYLLSRQAVSGLKEYLEIHSEDRSKADSTGSFIQFLLAGASEVWPLFVFEVERRFDLGHLQSYSEADLYFQSLEK